VTPQHVVIGRDSRIAYVGHLVDPPLEAALRAAPRAPAAAAIPVAAVASEPAYKPGDRVNGLSLVDIDGQTLSALDAVQRRPLALFFLSPWCESYFEQSRPARAGACRSMRTQIEALAADPGVRWVGVASGLWATREEVVEYRDRYKIRFPLVLDDSGALFRSFKVNEVPVVLILGADARIERRIEEPASDLRAALLAARPSAR
jgi:peroxiredoxin